MANTLFIGKVYHRFETLDSTNDWAKAEAAKNKPPEGMVVRADSQSAGRGQFGSRWESQAGANLTLSVLFYPHWLEAGGQFGLSMAVALGVREGVMKALYSGSAPTITPPPAPPQMGRGDWAWADTAPLLLWGGVGGGVETGERNFGKKPPPEGPKVSIKWPNDLYLDHRKTGGILIENTLSGSKIQSSVVGIGLNVNQMAFSSEAPNPTSLALASSRTFDPDAVAECLFECLERRYLQLKSGRLAEIRADYMAALYRLEERALFQRPADGSIFEGIIRGVTAAGYLQIETDTRLENFDLKQVRFLH